MVGALGDLRRSLLRREGKGEAVGSAEERGDEGRGKTNLFVGQRMGGLWDKMWKRWVR